jgi:hypothetical protein
MGESAPVKGSSNNWYLLFSRGGENEAIEQNMSCSPFGLHLQTYEKNLKRQRKRQDYLMLQLETRHLDAEPPIFLRIHETSIC